MAWDLACPDWASRIRNGVSLVPTLPLAKREADRAVAIFGALRLPDVAGRPALEAASGQWQRDIVAALFGSWDGKQRHVREIFALVPKKNAKTTTGAALMVTAVVVNRRPPAEVLIVAPTPGGPGPALCPAAGGVEKRPP